MVEHPTSIDAGLASESPLLASYFGQPTEHSQREAQYSGCLSVILTQKSAAMRKTDDLTLIGLSGSSSAKSYRRKSYDFQNARSAESQLKDEPGEVQ